MDELIANRANIAVTMAFVIGILQVDVYVYVCLCVLVYAHLLVSVANLDGIAKLKDRLIANSVFLSFFLFMLWVVLRVYLA
jgi:hypothetical protein